MPIGSMRSFLLAQSHGKAVDLGPIAHSSGTPARSATPGPDGECRLRPRARGLGPCGGRTRWPRPWLRSPTRSDRPSNWPISAATRTERWPSARTARGHREEPDTQRSAPDEGSLSESGSERIMKHRNCGTKRSRACSGLMHSTRVSPEEAEAIERHLETCPALSRRGRRASGGGIRPSATPSSPLPSGLWIRIAADLGDDPRRGDGRATFAVDAATSRGAAPAGTEESEDGGDELAGRHVAGQASRAVPSGASQLRRSRQW